ncbi:MAG: YncE family protein, partial [Acidimicrobiales bacterium]
QEARRLYCGDTMSSTMTVIDTDSLEVVATVPAELGAGAVAVDTRRGRAYCVNFLSRSVTVVDTSTNEAVGRIPVGEGACAVAVNPCLDEVYVVNSLASTVARIDALSGEVTGELIVPNAPVGLAAGPAGDRIYVGNRGDGTLSVLGVDGTEWARIPVGRGPGGVAVHPTHPRRLLVANAGSGSLSVVDDLTTGPPDSRIGDAVHPIVGRRLPDFCLPELHSGKLRHSHEWAERKYIINFFASW